MGDVLWHRRRWGHLRFLGMAHAMNRPCRHCLVRILDHRPGGPGCGATYFGGHEVLYDINVPKHAIYLVDGLAFAAPGAA